jgi:rfaE bifunctional protein nucleotidyltransferase chain/domain
VALANGCFDVLHVGHVRLLAAARSHCDVLVVALNSDESTRASKGPTRPIVPLDERLEVVAALGCVDFVTSFGEPTADAIIRALRPDLLVKGTDRTPDDVPERHTLAACGGRVLICGDPKSHSSSELIRRLGG